ncbi:MinD/ParA family ATP-binding protein [Nocardia carnea]|uniref:MinD/ParA family ATP-binding protein n=1 Tax=Nocardia carnea TaxID=37328 RepID=UPI0032B00CF7
MTTDDHNPTSQPWPPSQPADTAGGGEPEKTPPADPATDSPSDADADSRAGDTETSSAAVHESTAGIDAEPAAADNSQAPEAGTQDGPWPADPAAGPWGGENGFAPPGAEGQAPAGNGAAPIDSFAPPAPGGQFTAPGAEPFAPGSGQFTQPDPSRFAPANTGYPSGQFTQPDPGALLPPTPGHESGQFAQPDPNQFPPANTGYPSGQFAPPDANQFQTTNFAPGTGPFDQPNPYQASGPGGFEPPQPGGFRAPEAAGSQFEHSSGQFEQQPGFQAPGPESGAPHGSGQFPAADPNFFPGQHNPEQPAYGAPGVGGPGPDGGGQFDRAPGGYAPTGFPETGAAPTPQGDAPGSPVYGWAPPPLPAAPPQQQPFQQAPPPVGNPPSGQFGTPAWGSNPAQPAAGGQQPPQQPGQPQQGQFQPRHMPEPGQPGHSVNDLNLLKRARKAPRGGWRRAVHKVSRGVINPGESAADIVHRDLVSRVNAPVHGDFRIAILSLKGGVGKTTTTVGLGATFASLRGDRVIAIDANPDLGTLAHRVPRQTRSTVRNLLEDQNITRYSDVRAHTSQSPSRLEVLASEQDPAVSEAFSEADYRRAIGILQSFYNIILTDCGTGLMHSAMSGVLDMASSLVLVTSPAIDGARSASATLDWLDYHGYSHLVRQTVVVVNASRRGSTSVNLDHLRRLFLDRTRAVQVVPFDDHLAEGAEIDLELVSKPTRLALLELAAMVADDFANVDGYPYGNRY